MKKILFLFCILLSALMVMPESAEAQNRKKRKKSSRKLGSFAGTSRAFNPEITYYAIGGGINALNYFGDIAPKPTAFSTDISFTRPGVNLFLKQKFGDRYSWRANFMWGRLQASDVETVGVKNFNSENANRYLRNLSFRNDIFELSISGQLDLISHGGRFSSRPPFNLYFFAGIGLVYHNPKGLVPEYFTRDAYLVDNPIDFLGGDTPRYVELDKAGTWVSLRDLGTEGQFFSNEQRTAYQELYERELPEPYSKFQLVIPIGIGARYKLNSNFDIGIELSYRHTFTDYLDDVSGSYVDLGSFLTSGSSDPFLAMAMSDRSNQFSQEDSQTIREATYTSRINSYNTNEEGVIFPFSRAAGYGWPGGAGDARNARGDGGKENDIYIVTNITLTYILGGGIVKGAKFR